MPTLVGTPSSKETLKLKFRKGSMPTEQDFADLIHSGLNSAEDGIMKSADTPLRIQADGNEL